MPVHTAYSREFMGKGAGKPSAEQLEQMRALADKANCMCRERVSRFTSRPVDVAVDMARLADIQCPN